LGGVKREKCTILLRINENFMEGKAVEKGKTPE